MIAEPLKVRVALESDAAGMVATYAPIVGETAISFETPPPGVEDMAGRVRSTLLTHSFLICEGGREVVDYVYAGAHRSRAADQWSADVTVHVASNAQRGGIGRGLYGALIASLKARGFHAAFAGIGLPNDASVALHKAVGFEPFGVYREVGFKLGRWHDVGRRRRSLNLQTPPLDPIALSEWAVGWRQS